MYNDNPTQFKKFRYLIIYELITLIFCYSAIIISILNGNEIFYSIVNLISKTFQVGRLHRLIGRIPFLRRMMDRIISTVKASTPFIILVLIIQFIYTVFSVNLMAFLKPQEFLDEYSANFQSFHSAFILLSRISIGES